MRESLKRSDDTKQSLKQEIEDWDMNSIFNEISKNILIECQVPSPKVVILSPGNNPNCDANVHNACDLFYNDIGICNTGCLDIACNQAIFCRLILYKEKNKDARPLLSQWHMSKDICVALINIFLGYGIANMAATSRVLELIWVTIGITICKYLCNKNQKLDDIENRNYEMQMKNLAAFAPLFPVAGKINYSSSATYFLAYVDEDPHLQEHEIFMNASEMTLAGFYSIYTCYDLVVAHLQEILCQDVHKTEPRNTEGCRKYNVVVHKLISLSEYQKKELVKNKSLQNNQVGNNIVSTKQLYEQIGTKCQCRVMNDNEKKLLENLLKYDNFSEDKAIETLRQLQEQSND
ncbi:21268_t:CDS:2 [Cetraspora pellucida]|uniref:21268_t:CDS:1 n=1 Tax=Cetraspora pellucida TaxID=1433469 RepID=A0A9N9ILX7_9GLOM|nr:21268_t:CDS:2 [Cetraspora pellucida]